MNKIELEMIEKRFLKKSFKKNYITGEKEIVYYYPSERDYSWHKKRLIDDKRDDRPKWKEISHKKVTLSFGNDVIYAIEVKYVKQGGKNDDLV